MYTRTMIRFGLLFALLLLWVAPGFAQVLDDIDMGDPFDDACRTAHNTVNAADIRLDNCDEESVLYLSIYFAGSCDGRPYTIGFGDPGRNGLVSRILISSVNQRTFTRANLPTLAVVEIDALTRTFTTRYGPPFPDTPITPDMPCDFIDAA